jgi:hypothetical protein
MALPVGLYRFAVSQINEVLSATVSSNCVVRQGGGGDGVFVLRMPLRMTRRQLWAAFRPGAPCHRRVIINLEPESKVLCWWSQTPRRASVKATVLKGAGKQWRRQMKKIVLILAACFAIALATTVGPASADYVPPPPPHSGG